MKMHIANDTDCLQMLSGGETTALQYLIRIYFPVLCRYARSVMRSGHIDAEDVVEEVFIKLWQRHADFKNISEVKGFLYTSVRNSCLNILRSRQREQARNEAFMHLYAAEAQGTEREIIISELLALIRKAADELPPKMREIFFLSYYKKMSTPEIAEQLKLSHQTVRNQKSKALSLLKKQFHEKSHAFFLLLCFLSGLEK